MSVMAARTPFAVIVGGLVTVLSTGNEAATVALVTIALACLALFTAVLFARRDAPARRLRALVHSRQTRPPRPCSRHARR